MGRARHGARGSNCRAGHGRLRDDRRVSVDGDVRGLGGAPPTARCAAATASERGRRPAPATPAPARLRGRAPWRADRRQRDGRRRGCGCRSGHGRCSESGRRSGRRGLDGRGRRRIRDGGPRREQRERVQVPLVLRGPPHAEMDVGLADLGLAARPDRADRRSLRDGRMQRDSDRAEVSERHRVAVGGLDREALPRGGDRAGERHGPCGRCERRSSPRRRRRRSLDAGRRRTDAPDRSETPEAPARRRARSTRRRARATSTQRAQQGGPPRSTSTPAGPAAPSGSRPA